MGGPRAGRLCSTGWRRAPSRRSWSMPPISPRCSSRRAISSASDHLYVRAFDGTAWSDWTGFQRATLEHGPGGDGLRSDAGARYAGRCVVACSTSPTRISIPSRSSPSGTTGGWPRAGRLCSTGWRRAPSRRSWSMPPISPRCSSRRATAFGRDSLYVRAFDGTAWSEWTGFHVYPVEHGPGGDGVRSDAGARYAGRCVGPVRRHRRGSRYHREVRLLG